MLFNSIQFVVFFAVVYALYAAVRDYRKQNLMLLGASYVFYGAWDYRFVLLMLLCTVVNFYAAQGIARSQDARYRKLLLGGALLLSFVVLAFFKYFDFGIESLAALLRAVGFTPHLPTLNVILPVGISFYTFHTVSYTIDAYRNTAQPTRSFVNFALYVAYFPQLVAGPIQQPQYLLPHLERPRRVSREDFRVGWMWILLGYFKKIVIADSLAPMVDQVFAAPDRFCGASCLVAVVAFAVQIYGDFAGYTLMARGVSQLMGIPLIENFHMPYLAADPRDFWRRWHISLSSWLRNYLYLSLGGNRRGQVRTHINLMVTMLLGGLWHGANWTFVLWGGYHGLLLCLAHALGLGGKEDRPRLLARGLRILAMFGFTLFGWLVFRAQSMEQLTGMCRSIALDFRWDAETWAYAVPTFTMLGLLIAYHLWQEATGDMLILLKANPWLRRGVYAFLLVVIAAFLQGKPSPFIYFQF
jgi:D-alanyl-lipoteichoic acid acyltransferase DltB (MBOAT superfamily)